MPQEAVIYCRVSSERQAKEGDGVRSQEQRCRAFAEAQGYRVTAVFSDDGVSGAVIDRPGIQTLLRFLKSQPAEIVVVIDDISRIARDVRAHTELRAAIKAAKGRLESPSLRFEDTASGEFVEYVLAAAAQYGRKGNREQVLNRMRSRLEQGYWTFPAPPGYRYEKHSVHKKWIAPTKEAKRVLGPALESFANGRFPTQREMALHLKEQGFYLGAPGTATEDRPVSITVLEKRVTRLLDNLPLYAGFIEYPAWKLARVKARHEAILSPVGFALLEARLSKRGQKVAGSLRADAQAELPLRNFIRCGGCGRPLTGSLAKGRYPRYNCYCQECNRYGHSYSARELVEPAFEVLLRAVAPSAEFIEAVETLAPKMWKERVGEWRSDAAIKEREAEGLQEEVRQLVRRLGKVSDALLPELEKEIEDLKARAAAATAEAARCREDPPDYAAAYARVNTWFKNPHGHWKNGSTNDKRRVQRMVFTTAPAFDRERGFNTYDLSLPYRLSTSFDHEKTRVVDVPSETWHGFRTAILEWSEMLKGLEDERRREAEARRDEQLDLGFGW